MTVQFFVGIHQPSDAHRFKRCCISIHRLGKRQKPLGCPNVFIDSGAFTTIGKHGGYPEPVGVYAQRLYELHTQGVANIYGAAAQDYMCEPAVIAKLLQIPEKELSPRRHAEMVRDHQERTIARYDALLEALRGLFAGPIPFPVLPVIQGYHPEEYRRHMRMYGARLTHGMYVGVGSVCKRNGSVADVIGVLSHVKAYLPDLRLHGFGLKKTALKEPSVRAMLHSADSMAWSQHAYKHFVEQKIDLEKELGAELTMAEAKQILLSRGIKPRDSNDWREAMAFVEDIEAVTDLTVTAWQMALPLYREAAQ